MREVAEKWKKTATEDENNAENSADTSKHRERCHWLPGALIGCIRGNVARVSDDDKSIFYSLSFIVSKH